MIPRGLGGEVEYLSLWPVRVTTPEAVHLRTKVLYENGTCRIVNRRGITVAEEPVLAVVQQPPGWLVTVEEGEWEIVPVRGGCNCQADVVVARG